MSSVEPTDAAVRRQDLLSCPRWVLEKLSAAAEAQRRSDDALQHSRDECERLQRGYQAAAAALQTARQEKEALHSALQAARQEKEALHSALQAARQENEALHSALQAARQEKEALLAARQETEALLAQDREALLAEVRQREQLLHARIAELAAHNGELAGRVKAVQLEHDKLLADSQQRDRRVAEQLRQTKVAVSQLMRRSSSGMLDTSYRPSARSDQQSPATSPLTTPRDSTASSPATTPRDSSSVSPPASPVVTPRDGLSSSQSSSSLSVATPSTPSSLSTSASTSSLPSSFSLASPLPAVTQPPSMLDVSATLIGPLRHSGAVLLSAVRTLLTHCLPELLVDLDEASRQRSVAISVADHLVRYLVCSRDAAGLLACLRTAVTTEVTNCSDISTLGRGNTVLVRLLANVPRQFGWQLLSELLSPLLSAVIDGQLEYDADEPACLRLLDAVVDRLAAAVDTTLHPLIRITARLLVDAVEQHADRLGERGVHISLAGFLILRYISPVLTVPTAASPPLLTAAQDAKLKQTPAVTKTLTQLGRLLQLAANRSASKTPVSADVASWLSSAADRLAALLQRLPAAVPSDPLPSLLDNSVITATDSLDAIVADIAACLPTATATATATATPLTFTATASSDVPLVGTPFNLPVQHLLVACSSSLSVCFPDADSLPAVFALFGRHEKWLDALIEANAPRCPAQFSDAFVYLNYHYAPACFCENVALVLEGEVLQGAPFDDGSFIYHFLVALFKLLVRETPHFREHFQPIAAALLHAGRGLITDPSRLTAAELRELPARITAQVDLATKLLRALVASASEAAPPLWFAFNYLYQVLTKPPPMSVQAVVVAFAVWLLNELESLGLADSSLSASHRLVVASLSDVLRVCAGEPVKFDAAQAACPAFQHYTKTIADEVAAAALAWCRGPAPPARPPAPPSPAHTEFHLQRFRAALRSCSDPVKYLATPDATLPARIVGTRQHILNGLCQ